MVRDLIGEWNRGDVEAVIGRATEDLEWHPFLVEELGGGAFRGPEGFRKFIGDWQASLAHLFEFRGEEICRAQTFLDRDEALAFAQQRSHVN